MITSGKCDCGMFVFKDDGDIFCYCLNVREKCSAGSPIRARELQQIYVFEKMIETMNTLIKKIDEKL